MPSSAAAPASVEPITRRSFLALGSALLAATVASDLLAATAAMAKPPSWALASGDWPLSVGFVEGSDLLEELRVPPWMTSSEVRVVSAADLPLGDQTLAQQSVQMRVQGLYPGCPPRRRRDAFASAYLAVFAPSLEPEIPHPMPFLCWGAQRQSGANPASPTHFPIPLRDDGGLEVLVEVNMGRQSFHRFSADFTVDWYDGRPKLQRGIYLLGLSPEVWDSPVDLPGPEDPARYDLCSIAVSFDPLPEA